MPLGVLFAGNRACLTREELETLTGIVADVRTVPARTTVLRAGERLSESIVLLDGLMSRYIDDRRGIRQLVAVHVPGDFVDLHGYPMRRLDHDVGALTDARIAVFPHDALDGVLAKDFVLAKKMWFLTLTDAAIHREWIFRLGRLNAVSRVAHFFCEIRARFAAIGMVDGDRLRLPLTQPDIGDICGLTSVHVNRVLRQLRDGKLCTFRGGMLMIHDLVALTRVGEFDPQYLYLGPDC